MKREKKLKMLVSWKLLIAVCHTKVFIQRLFYILTEINLSYEKRQIISRFCVFSNKCWTPFQILMKIK